MKEIPVNVSKVQTWSGSPWRLELTIYTDHPAEITKGDYYLVKRAARRPAPEREEAKDG